MINLSVYQFQNKLKFLLFLLSDNKEFVVTVIMFVHHKLNKLKFLLFLLPVMKQFVVTVIICVHLKLNKLKFLLFLLPVMKQFVITVIICIHLKLNKLKFLLFLLPVMKQFVVTVIICVHLKLNKLKFLLFVTSSHETVCSHCCNLCTFQTRHLQLFFLTSNCCVMHLILYACSWLLFCDQQGSNFFYTQQQVACERRRISARHEGSKNWNTSILFCLQKYF